MEQFVPVHVEDFHEGTAGPTVSVPESVKEVSQLIFTDVIVDHTVKESNRYALLVMGQSTFDKWENVNRDIFAYMGIMVMMGLVNRPSFHDYWRRDPLYCCPPIAERIHPLCRKQHHQSSRRPRVRPPL